MAPIVHDASSQIASATIEGYCPVNVQSDKSQNATLTETRVWLKILLYTSNAECVASLLNNDSMLQVATLTYDWSQETQGLMYTSFLGGFVNWFYLLGLA